MADEVKPPPAIVSSCPHEHLRFEDGQLHIVCIDCNRPWAGLTRKGGATDYTLSAQPMFFGRDTRHDRWVLPRTEPVAKAEAPLVRCECAGGDGRCIRHPSGRKRL